MKGDWYAMAKGTAQVKPITPAIKNEPPDEVAPEILAKAIVDVAEAAKKLLGGRLTKRAILVLLADATGPGIGMGVISEILDAAANLKNRYVRSS